MQIAYRHEPFPYMLIDDYFAQSEVEEIWPELERLASSGAMLPPRGSGTARDTDGNILKQNRAAFLYDVYAGRESESSIIRHSRRLFCEELRRAYVSLPSWYFNRGFPVTNNDTVLVSYYETGDQYRPHHDCGLFTALTWFYREPKAFDGGDFLFPHFDINIPIKPNRCLIFPSLITHQVTPVTMHDGAPSLSGRFTISQFATAVPAKN